MIVFVKTKSEILEARGATATPWDPNHDYLCGKALDVVTYFGPDDIYYRVIDSDYPDFEGVRLHRLWVSTPERGQRPVTTGTPTISKAEEFLHSAAEIMGQRGVDYDQDGGERSMGKTVKAFNIITGKDLTEGEGWLLLQLLKDVRQWSTKGVHMDSIQDCIAYAALKAEGLVNDERN